MVRIIIISHHPCCGISFFTILRILKTTLEGNIRRVGEAAMEERWRATLDGRSGKFFLSFLIFFFRQIGQVFLSFFNYIFQADPASFIFIIFYLYFLGKPTLCSSPLSCFLKGDDSDDVDIIGEAFI